MIFPGRDTIIALGLAALVAGLWYVDHARLTAKYAVDMLAMRDAGLKALNNRIELVSSLKEKSREDASRIGRLYRDARVRICEEPSVPPSGDSTQPSAAGDGAGSGRDITSILRQCLLTFNEVTRALEAK